MCWYCTVKIRAEKTRRKEPKCDGGDDDDVADVALAAIAPVTLEFSAVFYFGICLGRLIPMQDVNGNPINRS